MATMDTAPPSYEEARNEGQTIKGLDPQPPRYSDPESQMPTPSEPPPSYESIYGRVKAAQLEAESKPQFFKKVMTIIMGTLGCTICLGIILAIPISMIVMGGVYYNDCPAEWRIPLYLIVGGSVGIIKNFSSLCQKVKNDRDNAEDENVKTTKVDSLLNCFLLAWFIFGNVIIYRTYGEFTPDKGVNPERYCNQTLYDYAFWLTTATYILLGSSCCCICFCGCLASLLGGEK
ncbi:transmembrane protein 272-like isoform X1 [Crassostrea virginica]